MTSEEIIARIKDYAADPLGLVFVSEMQHARGTVLWNMGSVQVRPTGAKYWSFPVEAAEFLRTVERKAE